MQVGKNKLFVTHGHAYGVKSGLGRLAERAKTLGADVVLYGHTHIPEQREIEGGDTVSDSS